MSDIRNASKHRWYRLWAVPLFAGGALHLIRAVDTEQMRFGLLGAGMVLGGIFALRHDLLDASPAGLDLRRIGFGWVALLVAGVLLVLSAAAVSLAQ